MDNAALPSDSTPPAKSKLGRWPTLAWKAIAAAVPVIGASIAIWQTLLAPPGPPAAPTAQVRAASVEPDVSLGNYLNGAPGKLAYFISRAKAEGATMAELKPVLDSRGVIATFSLDLKGPVGTKFDVMRDLFTARGDVRIPEANTTVVPPPSYVLHSPEKSFVDNTWIAYPTSRPGRYLVELVVLDAKGQILANKQTKAFSIR